MYFDRSDSPSLSLPLPKVATVLIHTSTCTLDPGRRGKRQAQEQEVEISEEAVADCGQDPDLGDAFSAACQLDWMFMGKEVIVQHSAPIARNECTSNTSISWISCWLYSTSQNGEIPATGVKFNEYLKILFDKSLVKSLFLIACYDTVPQESM